ncbi:odorant receptor Or2-like [Odontomachus brunneus]|uniref:odorant receptor Or2-like n=1 Tax=Odontomachus brunneus TaxID=486640 RepID=UPI0013F257B5|nr:odorant receptor Or2-like [Odontomachus brunneus]
MSVKKDLRFTFALSHQWLRLLGVWPDPHTSLSDIRRPKLRFMIVVCILSIYVFMPQFLNVIHSWGNVGLMVKHVASANYSLMALCKLIVTWYHGETLRTLMTSVAADWTTAKETWKQNTMLKIARRGRNMSLRCYISTTFTITFYFFANLLKFHRNMHQPVGQRKLVYHFDYYISQKSPNYEITYFIQMFGGIYTAFICSTIDSFVPMLLLHISAQLINLRVTLNKLVKKLAEKSISSLTFKKDLAAIIVRHEELIRNAGTIENCYSIVLLGYMVAATFQMCFECFQFFTIMTAKNVNISVIEISFLAFYFVVVLVHLYFYCYSAERLMAESTNIAYGVYECQWYDLPSKDAKDLMFTVYRSRIPLRLTAGKFSIFSLEMFGMMVKTSMGYLSMLLTMSN